MAKAASFGFLISTQRKRLICCQGDLDLDGNRRAQSYYRKIMWGKDQGIHLFSQNPEFTGKKACGLGWEWNDA